MDKAPYFESGDCRFESYHGRLLFTCYQIATWLATFGGCECAVRWDGQVRPCGLMDRAPDFGSGDCRFESCHGRSFCCWKVHWKIQIVSWVFTPMLKKVKVTQRKYNRRPTIRWIYWARQSTFSHGAVRLSHLCEKHRNKVGALERS